MTILALQTDFRDWLETGSDQAAARFARDAQAGLLVYQNNYRASLMACLEESFPRTAQWLGPADFDAAAARYIHASVPDSWSLDHYAARFPQALADQWPDDPEVGDLAALELALADAFVGPDAHTLDVDAMPLIDWDHAAIKWVPTARVLVMQTNAPAIWSALAADRQAPSPCPLPEAAKVLIWRQDHVACFRTLDPLEAEIADRLLGGMRFEDLCSRLVLAQGEADGVQTAGMWLGRWVADGMLDRDAFE